jgi:hypothetical protein
MDTKSSTSLEVLAMFSTFKEKRIKLYESFIRDIDDFEDWAISAEKLIAYHITVRNLRNKGKILKDQIQKEIIKLSEGNFTCQ